MARPLQQEMSGIGITIRDAAERGLLWHGVPMAAPQPLPTLLWHSHSQGRILLHSTHLSPLVA